jgi:hypothetical protein
MRWSLELCHALKEKGGGGTRSSTTPAASASVPVRAIHQHVPKKSVQWSLVAKGWSVPVSEQASSLKVDVSGVALGSVQEAQDTKKELLGSSAPAAVLVSSMVEDSVGTMVLLEQNGRIKAVRKYLVQVSDSGRVTFSPDDDVEEDASMSEGRHFASCTRFGGALLFFSIMECSLQSTPEMRPNMVEFKFSRCANPGLLWGCHIGHREKRSYSAGLCLRFFREFGGDPESFPRRRGFLATVFRGRVRAGEVSHHLVGGFMFFGRCEAMSQSSYRRLWSLIQSQSLWHSHFHIGLQDNSYSSAWQGYRKFFAP